MASLSQAKTYGGVGSILTLLVPVPGLGWLLAIVGFVLILLAVKNISDYFKDESIMNSMLVSILAAVAGLAASAVIVLDSFTRFMGQHSLAWTDFGQNFNPATIPVGDWLGLFASVAAGLVVLWVLLTVSGFYLRKGYAKIATDLNVGMFGTAGLVFFIGTATTIVLVGFLLIPLALILLAVAFFSIQESGPAETFPQAPQTQVP
jgi:uncharacterized membrane protein